MLHYVRNMRHRHRWARWLAAHAMLVALVAAFNPCFVASAQAGSMPCCPPVETRSADGSACEPLMRLQHDLSEVATLATPTPAPDTMPVALVSSSATLFHNASAGQVGHCSTERFGTLPAPPLRILHCVFLI